MMNLVEKFHAIMVSDKVFVWHYPFRDGPKFVYIQNVKDAKENWCDSLQLMVDGAYACIDPLLMPLPETVKRPSE